MTIYEAFKLKLDKYNIIISKINNVYFILVWTILLSFNIIPYYVYKLPFSFYNIVFWNTFGLGVLFITTFIYLQIKKIIDIKYMYVLDMKDIIHKYPNVVNEVKYKQDLIEHTVSNIINSIKLNNERININLNDTELLLRETLTKKQLKGILDYIDNKTIVEEFEKGLADN
jgi:hypothetical protein